MIKNIIKEINRKVLAERFKTWMESYGLSEKHEFDPLGFLNFAPSEYPISKEKLRARLLEASQLHQMIYISGKKIKELEERIKKLEG